MATTLEHNKARGDGDLLQRLIATAEKLNIPNAQMWVEQNMGRLVAANIDGTSIADVYAYADATYQRALRPGENPAAVTDPQLELAVQTLSGSNEQEAP